MIIHVRPSGYCLIQLSLMPMPSPPLPRRLACLLTNPVMALFIRICSTRAFACDFCLLIFFFYPEIGDPSNAAIYLSRGFRCVLRLLFFTIKSLFSARLLRYLQVFCFGASLCSPCYAWTLCYGPAPCFAGDRCCLLSLMALARCLSIVPLFHIVPVWYNSWCFVILCEVQ